MGKYSRMKEMARKKVSQNPSLPSIIQKQWLGTNYVDVAPGQGQVPFAQNVDFGDPIGAASKRGGLEALFASLGAGGIKGLHTFKHSSGDILLFGHGTKLYRAAGGGGSVVKTSNADWNAGTKDDVSAYLDSLILTQGTDFSEVDTLNADFNGTHSNTEATGDAVKLEKEGTDFSETDTLTADFDGTHSDTEAVSNAVKLKGTLGGNGITNLAATSTTGYVVNSERGWKFTVGAANITVSKLRVYAGVTGDVTIRLWRVSDQAKLREVTVSAIDAQWVEGDIADILLSAGASYIVSIGTAPYTSVRYNAKANNTYHETITCNEARYYDGAVDTFPSGVVSNIIFGVADIVLAGSCVSPGTYTHTEQDVSGAGIAGNATITFNKTTPANTTLTVETRESTDAGVTWGAWTARASGDTIITKGTDVSLYRVQWRANLATTDDTVTPSLDDATVAVTSGYKSSGTYTHGIQDISAVLEPTAATIAFNTTLPANTTATIETRYSLDGGATWTAWTARTTGDTIIPAGTDVANGRLQWRVLLATTDVAVTSSLNDVTVALTALQAISGTWTSDVIDLTNTPKTALLTWTVVTPAGTSLVFRVRSSPNGVAFGDWRTINASGDGIPLGKFVQVRVVFAGTVADSPQVDDLTVTYTTDYTTVVEIVLNTLSGRVAMTGNRVRLADWQPLDQCFIADGGRNLVAYVDAGVVKVRDAGVDAPGTAPTVAVGTGIGLTGIYKGKVTFVNDDNVESNPSDYATSSINGTLPAQPGTAATAPAQTGVSGTAQAGAASTITLSAGASATDNVYNNARIEITAGTGAGQVRQISAYNGTTKVATVSQAWDIVPNSTSVYRIRDFIFLAAASSATANFYNGASIEITAGTGAGQTRTISSYSGTNKTAIVSEAWTTMPDNTSVYQINDLVVLPNSLSTQNNLYTSIQLTGGTGSGQTREIKSYNGTTKVALLKTKWTTLPDNTSTFTIKAKSIVTANNDITWTFSVGPAGTKERRIYRTKAGLDTLYLLTTIEDNTTTTYTDTTADSVLDGTVSHPVMDDDNNIPPNAKIVYEFINYMIYVDADDETKAWFSKVGSPEQVQNILGSQNFKQFPGAVLGINETHNSLIMHGEGFVHPIMHSGIGFIFHPDPTVDTTFIRAIDKGGALSQESIQICIDPELRQIMMFPTFTGVRFLMPGLQEQSLESVPLSRNIQHPYYDLSIHRTQMAAAFYRNCYLLAMSYQEPGGAEASENNIIFVYDFRAKQWYGPWTIGASCFAIAGDDLYCGDSQVGKIYKMFSGSADDGAAIEMILDLPPISPEEINGLCEFEQFMLEVSAESVTDDLIVSTKVDEREASTTVGAITASFTGDRRPGHDTKRSRRFIVPLPEGGTCSHRIIDDSTNPVSIRAVVTEYEPQPADI